MGKLRLMTRRRLLPMLLLLLTALAAALFFALRAGTEPAPISAADSAACVAYLSELGWQADPEPIESLRLQLPEDLAARCGDYVALQKQQQLPFAEYAGQTVCRLTFRLTNYPDGRTDAQANLTLCGGILIAGDVMLLGQDGGQFPLAYPAAS